MLKYETHSSLLAILHTNASGHTLSHPKSATATRGRVTPQYRAFRSSDFFNELWRLRFRQLG